MQGKGGKMMPWVQGKMVVRQRGDGWMDGKERGKEKVDGGVCW